VKLAKKYLKLYEQHIDILSSILKIKAVAGKVKYSVGNWKRIETVWSTVNSLSSESETHCQCDAKLSVTFSARQCHLCLTGIKFIKLYPHDMGKCV